MSAFWLFMLLLGIVLVLVNLISLSRSKSIAVTLISFVSLCCAVYLICAGLSNLRVFS